MSDRMLSDRLIPSAFAQHPTPYAVARDAGLVRAEAMGCRDGDTLLAVADAGFHVAVSIAVRVSGIDTPELTGGTAETRAAAQAARDLTTRWLFAHPWLLLRTELLRNGTPRTSSDRWGAVVYAATPTGAGDSLGDVLRAAGLAVVAT